MELRRVLPEGTPGAGVQQVVVMLQAAAVRCSCPAALRSYGGAVFVEAGAVLDSTTSVTFLRNGNTCVCPIASPAQSLALSRRQPGA